MGVLHPMQQTVARVATRVWGNFRAERIEGRRFLVEAVTYTEVARELEALPASGISTELASADTPLAEKLQIGRQFPPAPPRSRSIDRIELASTLNSQRGLTLDWVLLNSTANLVLKGDTTYRVRSLANLTGVTKLEGGAVLKFDVGAQVRIAGTLECQTSPYDIAILTAFDDNTVGQSVGGSGNPWGTYYAANALYFEGNISDVRHVRILHAQQGIRYAATSGSPHLLSHVQFIHCQQGIVPDSTTVHLRNALMQDVQTAFWNSGASAAITVEHLTADAVPTVNGTSTISLTVTNSLFAGVSTFGPMSGSHFETVNAAETFQVLGAGGHYLAVDSPYRDAGSTDISAALKADLATMTTCAPRPLNGNVDSELAFLPAVDLDLDTADLGYHYSSLDYLASNVVLNAALTLKSGVAIGISGSYGFRLNSGASFSGEGWIQHGNRLVHYQVVQEQPQSWGGTTFLSLPASAPVAVQLRLTEVSSKPGIRSMLLDSIYAFQQLSLKDCQLRQMRVCASPAPAAGITPAVNWINNLLDRCDVSFYHSYGALNSPNLVTLRNNLFLGGSLLLNYDYSSVINPIWQVRDNLLDGTTQTMGGGVWASYIQRSHNAFTTGTSTSLGGNPAYTGLNRDFQKGPLGGFYYPPSAASPSLGYLVNRGSQADSGAVGLFHHTTQVNQTKEEHSTLDIGYHYLAVQPAEAEVPKSTMTASGSSTGFGWLRKDNGVKHGHLTYEANGGPPAMAWRLRLHVPDGEHHAMSRGNGGEVLFRRIHGGRRCWDARIRGRS